jgi:EAL domain-containing protein (putative c-di-GMP-specific phosphodiesterase class I)
VTLLKAAGCSIVQGFLFGVPKRVAAAPANQRRARDENATARSAEASTG